MKIIGIRAVQPETPGSPPDWRTQLGQILIRVDTDDGLSGYGIGGGGCAGIHVVETVLREFLMGKDASDVVGLWDRMFLHTLPYGQKGLVIMAISGVDLALWDLRGKRENKSIEVLLGGAGGTTVPMYKTGWSPEEVAEGKLEGYRALKLHMGRMPVSQAVDQVARVRKALGDGMELMADAFMGWDLDTAIHLSRQLADYNLVWLEEPIRCDDLSGYARLRDESPVPIAGGEHEYTSAAFEYLMRERLHTIFQPDVCWCGGLTELIRIYALGKKYGLRVCPHRGSEVWSLHAIAALDPDPMAESGRPWMRFVHGQPEPVNGTITLADTPGFGVSFDEDLWI
ncbi:MAG: mandelate racemase/muconate lactonizing enzyme family protein [bacterium]|nr:mandelate racemase/muconate lactonizing enzyme family protein [bacterium]